MNHSSHNPDSNPLDDTVALTCRLLRWSILLGAAAIALFFALTVFAEPLTLAWDPSPDAGVAAYRLHYGNAPGQYQFVTNVGPVLTATVEVSTNATWFFAVTALGTNQLESDFSNEVGWPKPSPPAVPARPHVRLTPVAAVSDNGGPWIERDLWPTFLPATNTMTLFKGLRIECVQFLDPIPQTKD